MLGFQNLPTHPKLQSASIGSRCSSSKGFFSLGFSPLVFGILYKHAWGIRCTVSSGPTWLCQIVLYDQGFVVLFFFQIDFVNMFQKKIKEFQIFFPISAKVMPWSLWKWMWPQCIFEGKHFPNSIGFSPGKAQVTNIDLKCSFFTGLQKVKAGSHFFSNCAWGFHEDGYWNQPW